MKEEEKIAKLRLLLKPLVKQKKQLETCRKRLEKIGVDSEGIGLLSAEASFSDEELEARLSSVERLLESSGRQLYEAENSMHKAGEMLDEIIDDLMEYLGIEPA